MEVGRQLFSVSDPQTQIQLQTDLTALKEDWEQGQCMLGKRKTLTSDIIKKWETRLADQAQCLEEVRARLKQSLPDQQEEMEEERLLVKEVQDCLEDWAVSLSELSTMKTDVSQYIFTDDVLLLQEQVDHLHCQWEELCLKVSLRKQEIADRLNAWIIFNEKNRELCEWLTQTENKVAHSAELSIEEMVEKLKKDCMEEINLFSENKTHLKQLGEQLITASNKTKETEINDKIKDINDRWQHLFDHIEDRVRKLKETLGTVQQLDKNMINLRTWLSGVEGELAKPIIYSICHSDEIQRKLAEHQDLQRDIEQHTDGVASVLTLCDVLLHDGDACSSDGEDDSIQQTTFSLDRRWRNICAMSMERRMRIEETWRLWCKILEDYSRFEEWLSTAECTAVNPATKDVPYTCAKEELKKFEAFQRQVHERQTQLELVNKQYRRLARENRTDGASKLKLMVHEGNQRWDTLQKRVAAVLRRLKHFTSQREDFEGTREGILVWLTEMDLQLTNVEHFSESDIHEKMRQLNAFQQEITLNTNKIDALIVFGENLIQKSAPLDAVLIEDELEELHSYCQEVFGRVARFHHRLISRRPVLEEDREFSDRDTDPEDSADFSGVWEREREEEEEAALSSDVPLTVRQAVSQLLHPALERSGRETPVSVDSIPLEWDHTVDVGGSSSPEDDEELMFYSALSDVEVTESSQLFFKATSKALKAVSGGRSVVETWHSPDAPDRQRANREIISSLTSSPFDNSAQYHPQAYDKLMFECAGSIDSIKRVKLILSEEEQLDDQGLTVLSVAEKTGVIERWELLEVQSCSVPQDLQQWHKLNSDLSDVMAWLNAVMPELDKLQTVQPKITIRDMESSIHKLKDTQRTFNGYKSVMIGVNLSGRGFQHGDSTELRELRENLQSANQKWAQACVALDSWEHRLHQALMECQEFHETLHSLLLWLAKAESQRYMVNIHDRNTDLNILQEHQHSLKAVQQDLQSREREVFCLQEISSQILLQDHGEDTLEAKEKVHVISNKLRLLIRQIAHDLDTLQSRLDSSGPNVGRTAPTQHQEAAGVHAVTQGSVRAGKSNSSPARLFLYRVLRAAFPLHILFLLLLVVACLVPLSEDDYSCTLSNNFARSFYPMLLYINGPPPT
ncbi:nesprin-2-like [Carassius auratus]|uniref:Nesprin-2-like n=1 Tax=Carassius auratus TaxID=7957 RepID=A0A6P6QKG0_CARAU|nr:nesprin-2-like [Carassius auratus]